MKYRQSVSLIAIAASTLWLTACGGSGGSSSNPTPPAAISVAFSAQAPSSLVTSATASLTAIVSNDSKNAGVNWSCAPSSACGSFSAASTASGAATTYTAPAAVPTAGTVTVTATSVTDTTKTASATITITAPAPAITVTLTPTPPSSLVSGTTASLTAVVANDSKSAGVNWSVTCGSSGACGSFNPTGTASNSATTYTAPAAVPTSNTVTVTATSVTDPTKNAQATITITAPILANSTYVYHFSGENANGPVFFAGAFTVSGGVITGGEQDFSDPKNGFANALVPSGSSITTAADGNIQIVLATSNTAIGVNGVVTLRGAKVSSSRVLISEFDSYASATGSIDLQTSAAAPAGGYAFVVSGWYLGSTPTPLVFGGVLNISGTSLVAADSVFDYNNGGNVGQGLLFSSGTVSAPDAFGRVTFTLTPSSSTNVPAFILTGYIVGTNQIQLVESQTDALTADLGGTALGQGTNTFQFTQASIANSTYVYSAAGEDIHGLTSLAGNFVFGPSGSISGTLSLNDLTAVVANDTITGGSFVVDQTGRVTMNGVGTQQLQATFTFQLYLDGNGNALEMGADNLQDTAGVAYLKTATSADFEGNYALGGQGFLKNTGESGWGAAGPVAVSSDALKGFTDYTAQGATPSPNVALTGTENSSTGALSITGLNAVSFTTASGFAYYPIDSTRVLAIEVDGAQVGLLRLEQVH